MVELPEPDQFGNFWLSGHTKAPAILKGGEHRVLWPGTKDEKEILRRGKGDLKTRYFLSLSSGIVFDGDEIMYFRTPKLALDYFKEHHDS